MKLYQGTQGNRFTLSFVYEPPTYRDEKECQVIEDVFKVLNATSHKLAITSMDSYCEQVTIGASIVDVTSDAWDTVISSTDGDIIGIIKDLIEKRWSETGIP